MLNSKELGVSTTCAFNIYVLSKVYLQIPPKTPAILQSHRYHHVMPSSSGVCLLDVAVSSELIVIF